MSKKKTEGGITPAQWVIRALILIIFLVAIGIGVARLMEREQLRLRGEAAKEQKEAYEQADGASAGEPE